MLWDQEITHALLVAYVTGFLCILLSVFLNRWKSLSEVRFVLELVFWGSLVWTLVIIAPYRDSALDLPNTDWRKPLYLVQTGGVVIALGIRIMLSLIHIFLQLMVFFLSPDKKEKNL